MFYLRSNVQENIWSVARPFDRSYGINITEKMGIRRFDLNKNMYALTSNSFLKHLYTIFEFP